jgi:hypothetical protein
MCFLIGMHREVLREDHAEKAVIVTAGQIVPARTHGDLIHLIGVMLPGVQCALHVQDDAVAGTQVEHEHLRVHK